MGDVLHCTAFYHALHCRFLCYTDLYFTALYTDPEPLCYAELSDNRIKAIMDASEYNCREPYVNSKVFQVRWVLYTN